MDIEVISFRFVLLIAVISFIFCASYSGYSYYQSEQWQHSVELCLNNIEKYQSNPRDGIIDWQERFDEIISYRDKCDYNFTLFLKLAGIIPPASFFLFYAIRWGITGRLKPFWPKKTS